MAQHKDYGLIGAGRNLQLGKLGPKLEGNADSGAITEVLQVAHCLLCEVLMQKILQIL